MFCRWCCFKLCGKWNIKEKKVFKNIWIQPAAGDAGGALGAVLVFWHLHLKKREKINRIDDMQGSFLGPMYKEKEIRESLDKLGANYKLLKKKISVKIAKFLADGKSRWLVSR